MNVSEFKILSYLHNLKGTSQREVSEHVNISLGKTNKIIKNLIQQGYIDTKLNITPIAKQLLESQAPQRAVILAAGMGFRMIPLNKTVNKALLSIHGTTLIEHLIKQLQEAGIYDITVVVGYQKEEFEFLIDEYNVKLHVNAQYAETNSLYSLYQVKDKLSNCYIVPCDLYFYKNPFLNKQYYSWYLLNSSDTYNIDIHKLENSDKTIGSWYRQYENQQSGLAYITDSKKESLLKALEDVIHCQNNKSFYWEQSFIKSNDCIFTPRFISSDNYIDCNCCEDLIRIDDKSPSLDSEVFDIIMDIFHVQRTEIKDIICTKAGMTNNSFLFTVHDKRYIMRIPGEGTASLINRKEEYEVYQKINDYQLSDKVYYFDSNKGYKITEFIENAHNCNAYDRSEVEKCMTYLHDFHSLNLKVNHYFDIFDKIEYYENLWKDHTSMYKDYERTKSNVYKLKSIIDKIPKKYCLTHIDAVPDNFIFHYENNNEHINLIDWEYASMQDPHVDIAMFAIYSLYEQQQIDDLIDMYFNNQCSKETRIKIYCYIAACGLLWSNWCEYKHHLGVDFGEYSLKQYRYAKDFYKIVMEEIEEVN